MQTHIFSLNIIIVIILLVTAASITRITSASNYLDYLLQRFYKMQIYFLGIDDCIFFWKLEYYVFIGLPTKNGIILNRTFE